MDFFEHQDKAKNKSSLLFVTFILAVVGTVLIIYLTLVVPHILTMTDNQINQHGNTWPFLLWNQEVFIWVTTLVGGTIAVATLFKVSQLKSGGGAYVAKSLGGRLVVRSTNDLKEIQLLNVVEEMSIASGVPVPQVFVLDREEQINAFAAGFSTHDAVVAVTRGTLKKLNRDELQAVIAHEFSHIFNGDMNTNIKLIGSLFGLMLLTKIGYILLRVRSRGRGSNPIPLIGFALIVAGGIGYIFGKLIKAAISRQREFLADASAVQYTRNPNAVANVLKKVGAQHASGIGFISPNKEEASHMFFVNFGGFFATHPPVEDRILAIDPGFDGNFENHKAETINTEIESPSWANKAQAAGSMDPAFTVAASAFLEALDTDDDDRYVKNKLQAQALCFALIHTGSENHHSISDLEPELKELTLWYFNDIKKKDRLELIPLINLAIPELKELTEREYSQFSFRLAQVAQEDHRFTIFEFCIIRTLRHILDAHFGKQPIAPKAINSIKYMKEPIEIMLGAFVHFGMRDPEVKKKAFDAAAEIVGVQKLNVPTKPKYTDIRRALNRLSQASHQIKKQVIMSIEKCVMFDDEVNSNEEALLLLVSIYLQVPISPFSNASQIPS